MEPEKKSLPTEQPCAGCLDGSAQPVPGFGSLLCVGLGLGGGVLLIFQARFLSRIIHGAFMENRSIDVLVPFFSLLVGIIIVRALLGWVREVCGFYAGAQIRQRSAWRC